MEITGVLQKYAWGKHGDESEVAKLFSSADESFRCEPFTPYAELWLGTHPKGPSVVKSTGEFLSSWLLKHPEANHGCHELPYLLKVLSVETALSIQIHPNKDEAIKLHARSPKDYPDNNHKPEMAIALTPFEALCGFRPWNEIVEFIESVEELRKLVCEVDVPIQSSNDKSLLKAYFTALMNCDEKFVKIQTDSLINRIKNDLSMFSNEVHQLFVRLHVQYPGDIGCFCVYFFNYITLKPGEAIFLESGLPHAYLKGDCIECMACSDNVIRAGLTPKMRDIESLCEYVNYINKKVEDVLFSPRCCDDSYTKTYNPPTPEFSVDKIELPPHWGSYSLPSKASSSILLVVEGSFDIDSNTTLTRLGKGSAIFIAANEMLQLKEYDSNYQVLVFRAYSE